MAASSCIGGLISNEYDHSETRVPLLGSIPLLGELFKDHSATQTKKQPDDLPAAADPARRHRDVASRPTPSTTSSARSSARSAPVTHVSRAAAAGREVPGAAADPAAAAAGLDSGRADHRASSATAPPQRRRPIDAASRTAMPPRPYLGTVLGASRTARNERRRRHRRPGGRGQADLLCVRQAARRAGRRDHRRRRALHGARRVPRPWPWPKCGATCACRCSIERVDEATFDALLRQAYETGATNAMDAVGGFEGNEDLTQLAQVLPEQTDLLEADDDAPIIRLINAVLTQAVKENASDIHIEPFENRLVVRFRVDGVLREVLQSKRAVAPLVVSRIKVMSKLDIAEKRLPQDGRISLRIAGRAVDVRVSTIPERPRRARRAAYPGQAGRPARLERPGHGPDHRGSSSTNSSTSRTASCW